jgi:hypothetical protein
MVEEGECREVHGLILIGKGVDQFNFLFIEVDWESVFVNRSDELALVKERSFQRLSENDEIVSVVRNSQVGNEIQVEQVSVGGNGQSSIIELVKIELEVIFLRNDIQSGTSECSL